MLLKVKDRELGSDEEEGSGVEEQDDDDEDVDAAYGSIAPVKKVEDSKRVYTDATVWIGVLPDSLSGARAFDLTTRIRLFLNGVTTSWSASPSTVPSRLATISNSSSITSLSLSVSPSPAV